MLAAGSGDGSIGDHGEVIAEHCAADHGAQNHQQVQTALFRNADSDGSDGGDGTHGGAGCRTHERADDKQARRKELDRHEAQAHVHGGVAAAHGGCHGSECTGEDVNDQHGEHIHVGGSLGERIKLFIDAALEHDECHQNSKEHCRNRGELIECHFNALRLIDEAGAHVNNDKDQERDQRKTIGFFAV